MHYYGGLYLDLDIECYKPADESLRGYQVVLQGAGDEGVNNAVLASVAGLSMPTSLLQNFLQAWPEVSSLNG